MKIEAPPTDLVNHLLPCPSCGASPALWHRMWTADGRLPRRQTLIECSACSSGDEPWHDSLYEAVSVWEVRAKMVGTPEKPVDWNLDPSTGQPWDPMDPDQEFYDRQDYEGGRGHLNP